MRTLLAVTLMSLAWRRWATLGLLLCATAAFAAAAVGPLWANAAEDSLVQRLVVDADAEQMSLTLRAHGNDLDAGNQIPALAVQAVQQSARLTPLLDAAFGPPRLILTTNGRTAVENLPDRGRRPTRVLAALAWLPHGCERLTMTLGRCPVTEREVALSGRTARLLHVRVGQRVSMPQLAFEPPEAGTGVPFPSRPRLVGIYRPPGLTDPAWSGSGLFDFSAEGLSSRDPVPPRVDAAFTVRPLLERLADTPVRAEVRRHYVPAQARADAVDPVETALAAWDADHRAHTGQVELDDAALATMAGIRGERDTVRLASFALGLQLLVLVCYVLFMLTAATAESRSHDLALAKLRGLGTGKVTLLGLLEPLTVVVTAVPLGVLAALGLMRVATGSLLPDAVPLRPDLAMLTALAVALAGAATAAALGLRSTLGQPVLAQLVRATPTSARRPVLLLEAAVVTAAIAALWQVRAREGEGELAGLALLAPGLAAVAVALVGARVLHQLAALWARRTRFRPGVAGFLAARQIGRRAGGARIAVIVTVTTALAAFAASTWGLVERQRDGQAAMEVGASRVYRVDAPSAGRLLGLVRDLDPGGRALTAAVEYPGIAPADRVLAVDSTRLAATSAWQPAWAGDDVRAVARRLRTDVAPSITMIGKTFGIGLDGALLSGGPEVGLVATVVDRDGRESPLSFGRMTFGPQTLTAQTDACLRGCRLAALGLVRLPGEIGVLAGQVTFRAITVDGVEVRVPFRRQEWRAARVNEDLAISSPVSKVSAVPGGLLMRFTNSPSQSPGVVRADVPLAIPLVAAGATTLADVGRDDLVMSRGLDVNVEPSRVVGRATVLPRLGTEGVLADLELASRAAKEPAPGLVFEVWANDRAAAPAELRRQLRVSGLPVVSVETIDERRHQLGRTGSAMALTLLIGVALSALAVAVLAVLATALVEGRRRAYELVALRTAGVPERVLRRSSWREYAVQLGFGTGLGLVSGAATARLLGDSIADLGRSGAVAPVTERWEWAALAAVAAVSVLLFAVVAQVCARVSLRFAQVDLLRAAAT